ncbi:MAG: dephospho-CoA kinase [Bacteroidales bacterium]|nr:dephospho-CoA kinase [Bacteroidales bacterium]
MIKVGLTGGIGTGKSTAVTIFKALDIPVFDSDSEAKKFLLDSEVKKNLMAYFGEEIFFNGEVNRKALAAIVFTNNSALSFLNSLIHPLVRQAIELWFDRHQSHPYAVLEAAVLFEYGFYKQVDKIITVRAPFEERIKRVMIRDGITKEEVVHRMNNQLKDNEVVVRSDFVLHNAEHDLLLPQILQIHQELSSI